jgi:hypothetical protein
MPVRGIDPPPAFGRIDTEYRDFLDTYKGYALSPGRDIRVSLSVPFGG